MEPFPSVEDENGRSPIAAQASTPTTPTTNMDPSTPTQPNRTANNPPNASSSTTTRRLRSASLKFLESNPPSGMWMATGDIASRAPTLNEIRTGCFSADGWTEEGQLERRGSTAHEIQRRKLSRAKTFGARIATSTQLNAFQEHEHEVELQRCSTDPLWGSRSNDNTTAKTETKQRDEDISAPSGRQPQTVSEKNAINAKSAQAVKTTLAAPIPDETGTYPNGYRFPPKHTWTQATIIGLRGFARFVITPFGFLVTLYGLNIVAWGAMIFFLLLNVAPAMCNPSCTAAESARQIWIEIDSQILNALFCVTGFGLIPWRFRDFYYLLQWRVMHNHDALRKLAGVHRGWFRLAGSEKLPGDLGPPPVTSTSPPSPPSSSTKNKNGNNNYNMAYPYTDDEELTQLLLQNPSLPLPPTSIPPAPLTGARAPPTKPFLMDLLVWMYVINTALQAGLAGIMWGLNRFTRPSWAVGFLIAAGCVTGMVAGGIAFWEGRRVKMVEGVSVEEEAEEDEGGDDEEGRGGEGARAEEGLGLHLELTRTRTRTKSWKRAQWYRRL
ncbi:hypothetical protein BDBG_04941 [Blastomyces gilchristii SLH14081]|uniref:Alpha-L-rhamnosidase C n=1 Tax=Blastomyces gilchristii (strain SLH14081) TaxID=559298 RepID=A0A179ULL9_BLAGS|nr:uncharacterized protein BDBG_04941 [Blastomyces gilchristii SLH14081]OAT08703.1 hypothetical protein BDBG_04941 [Blastomyces gilchristii SLH14081]